MGLLGFLIRVKSSRRFILLTFSDKRFVTLTHRTLVKLANMALDVAQWFIIGFLLLLPLLYELSSFFRYYAKILFYYTCIMSTATVIIFYGVFRPGDVRNHWFVYFLIS